MRYKLTAFFLLAVVFLGFYTYKKFVTPFSRGESSPLFVLKNTTGEEIKLTDFRGQKVLLHFWATWCPNCVDEIPHLESFAKENPDIKILAVNEDDLGAESVANFFGGVNTSMIVLLDEKGKVADLFKSYMVPQTYLIDEDGRFLDFFMGAQNWYDSKLLERIKGKPDKNKEKDLK